MVTLKDIALKTGVSVRTVSVVLNDKPNRISVVTAKKIRHIARQLNYRPNLIARATRTKKTNQIGILVAELANPYTGINIEVIEQNLSRYGYKLLLGLTGNNIENAKNYLREFSHGMVDGILNLVSTVDEPEMKLTDVTVPYIHYLRPSPHFNLTYDYITGMELALEHLWALGHRRIGFIGGPDTRGRPEERLKGFQRFFEKRKLSVRDLPIRFGDWTSVSGQANAPALLQRHCTAVIGANDQMTLGAMKAAQDIGLKVPHDISFVGFDNSPSADISNPSLTSVAIPFTEAAAQTVAALIGMIEGSFQGGSTVLLPRLVIRHSTAAAKV